MKTIMRFRIFAALLPLLVQMTIEEDASGKDKRFGRVKVVSGE